MLQFNTAKYDFNEISTSILRFYPIGISPEDEGYFSYPGIQELDKIVVDNISNESNYKSRWTDFTKEIGSEVQTPLIGTTYGQNPSFSALLQLETASLDNLFRTKELHFYLSLIGPFYTILGQDNNTVKVDEKLFRSTNYLTVSPINEYSEVFKLVAARIESRFTGYRFVPFGICKQKIEGLHVRYHTQHKVQTVFNALFKDNATLTSPIMGDWTFGYDDWIKADFNGIETSVELSPP